MNPARFDWHKTPAGHCHLLDFARHITQRYQLEFDNYFQLQRWSTSHREAFWQACFDATGIIHHRAADKVLLPGSQFWQDRWFSGCTLNYAENLLRYRDQQSALIFCDERGNRQTISYQDLYQQVSQLSLWLSEQGLKPGDRVAGFTANRIETVIAMLATTALGAIWTACSPDFGFNGILDRFTQTEPVILFAVSSHCYAGKIHGHTDTLRQLTTRLPSIRQLVLLPELYGIDPVASEITGLPCPITHWHSALQIGVSSDTRQNIFTPVSFDHPLFILYSSGTTGAPKCIVHSHGGTLLQHRKEHHLHLNLQRQDVLFYFTTCGWMMWNWLVSGLAAGATLILYDGSPFHPSPDVLFDLCDELDISIFGTSARYLASAEQAGLAPAGTHQLNSLHTILSTGSPLSASSFDYVYQKIKPQVALQSMSGGTDILSCFVLGNPVLPVHRGEIQCAGLGMDMAVFNDNGQPVSQTKGELVCRQSFPSMPTGFWNDPEHKKYRAAYFEKYPDTWAQGDYAELTASGGWIIYGRSDTVLNPGGVRIGTAEIYRQLEPLPQIIDAVAVGQQWQGDVRIILFVRLADGLALDETLIAEIRRTIRQGASPRHVPAHILQVSDVPRTLNGKLAEIAVRDTLHGKPVGNQDALINPSALLEYQNLRTEYLG